MGLMGLVNPISPFYDAPREKYLLPADKSESERES
jgi:hypothetical protein